ncbi:MAG TPA: TolC family protein, partial [Polyangia bacterium]|nr:TolC family protein [Polyangia bacterium]
VGASWDALGLVDEMARVDAALASAAEARAGVAVQRLTVAYSAADQFLDLLSQDEIVRAAQASVDRARALATIVDVLVTQQLRPGADSSRARAELALAVTQLIHAQQADEVRRTALARALGAAGRTITVRADNLASSSTPKAAAAQSTTNPIVVQASAVVRAAEAQKRAVQLQYLPRLNLVASLWVRGSGLSNATGSGALPPSANDGLTPDTPNWAAGLVLTWPALEIVAVHARTRVAQAQLDVARAQREDAEQSVQSQIDTAVQVLEAAGRIAANTPVALSAARAAESQATARYRAGLATVVEVAEAQRLLAQTEADDAVAHINVRRAQLLLARAVGDLEPFFAETRGR